MGDPNDDSDEKRRIHKDGVSHDQRGNAVWKWAADSGRHLMESTSALLKRLEVPGLKLEEDASGPRKQPGLAVDERETLKKDAGYDPYGGKRTPPAGAARPTNVARPAAAARPASAAKPAAAARSAATKPAAVPPPRRSMWRRWFGRD